MKLDDLFQVIDDYNEDVFERCKDTLYTGLGFIVLKKEEIRRNDVKEKLAELFSNNESIKEAEGNIAKPLASFIQRAFSTHLVFDSERVKEYKSLADKYITKINKDSDNISIVENLILIFISFFYDYKEYFQEKKREGILKVSNTQFILYEDDVDVADYILQTVSICERYEKGVVKKKQKVSYFKESERQLAYIITVLFIYRILQIEGEL